LRHFNDAQYFTPTTESLQELDCSFHFNFYGKRMLFFGCGGVSSAVAVTLSKVLRTAGFVDLHRERTNNLEALVRESNPALQIATFDATSLRNFANFDVFYNGSGLGKGMNANSDMAASPLKADDILPSSGAAFDANYTPQKPLFLRQLEPLGFSAFNGLSHMLASTAIHLSVVTGSDFTYRSVESIYRSLFEKE
jgi:shikimate 5-dehydrogenase